MQSQVLVQRISGMVRVFVGGRSWFGPLCGFAVSTQ